MANGCFDLIHVGHIRYLKESKYLGDILMVALNSDLSVRRLKGPGRPLMTQKDRAEILCAFSMIDFLTIFDEPDVGRILLAIRPHVHAKGSDYTKDSVPERKIVESYGGEVAITGGPKVRSTREVIRNIYNRIPPGYES